MIDRILVVTYYEVFSYKNAQICLIVPNLLTAIILKVGIKS